MPIERNDIARRSLDPGPDELDISLPYWQRMQMHGSHNGSLRVVRLPDGGAEISCRQDVHQWGQDQVIRLDKDAWEVVQAFVAGGPGASYITPYRETALHEEIQMMMAKAKRAS